LIDEKENKPILSSFCSLSEGCLLMTELNENHKQRLLIGFRYINDLLSDMERVMATPADVVSPFQIYVGDVTQVQQKIIAAEIDHIRVVIRRILENKDIKIDQPAISAVKAVRNSVYFADMAIEKMKPKHMRGYGALTDKATRELDEVASQMQGLLKQILRAVR
jgi:hypothetical protein